MAKKLRSYEINYYIEETNRTNNNTMNKKRFNAQTIEQIECNLKLHINYKGKCSGGKYIKCMDELTFGYGGPRGLALSNMLKDYFKQVGVSSLDDALQRLRVKEYTATYKRLIKTTL